MRTDWALVQRLAFELRARLCGARVQDAGLVADGRPAIVFWSHGEALALCMDLFGSPPVLTIERQELSVEDSPFSRALRALRDSILSDVEAREHDRLLTLGFRTRSRFGVPNDVALSIELVPRFGNAVVVKNGTVVAALKEFGRSDGGRATLAGLPYELPPLPNEPPALASGDLHVDEPLFVYRKDGVLVQAHLLALEQFSDAVCTREESLLDLFAEDRRRRIGASDAESANQRRSALARRIETRLRRVRSAIDGLSTRESEAARADAMRAEGEAIYATLHELQPDERSAAKDRAAKTFARYRKVTAARPHIEVRRRELTRKVEALETLAWETGRADDAALAEIATAFASMERSPQHRQRAAPTKRKRRTPLEVRTEQGSRILVGRSPAENAELTFRVARSEDLWFHARGTPGAHVILARDDRAAPPDEDIALAASLAARHSKARESAKVTVDYTQRKHVRKQPDAPPGLVFYTSAKSITVAPAATDT